jgi:hypothetical protein
MSPKLQGNNKMYLIVIAWLYVTLLMALAEAFSSQGSVLGAIITFVLYGLLPMSLVVYLGGTPLRRREARRQEAAALPSDAAQVSMVEPNASGHASGLPEDGTVTAVRKEP